MRILPTLFPLRYYLAVLAGAGLLPPLFITLFGWVNGRYAGGYAPEWSHLALDVLTSIFFSVCIGLVVARFVEWLREVLPWNRRGLLRLLAEGLGSNLIAALVMAVLAWGVFELKFMDQASSLHELRPRAILNNVLIALLMNNLLVALFEGMIIFRDLQKAEVRAERLEREKLESQLEILKNQLKPHFLFNSLNVLSSLVHSDAARSEAFIAAFSQVYRYVLDSYQQPLVPLARELSFVRAYLFLQGIRFGEAMQVQWDETALGAGGGYLPPLSLQLLLENAFKHNELSVQQPLRLSLTREGDTLALHNTYRPRSSGSPSPGLGQANLLQRYRLLGAEAMPTFAQREDEYRATLPLITDDDEGTDR